MDNYSSQLQRRSMAPNSCAPSEQIVQRQLQSVVENLGWSYVALWSLNRHTRNLGWKGGHFRMAVSGSHGSTEVWNEQLFDSTYKSCHFTHNLGSVGTAHAEGRSIWMNGPSVLKNAGSKEQAEFLQHARIMTAICVPWTDGVLELGTSENVPENPELMENIRQFVSERILPALGEPSSQNSHLGVSSFTQSTPFLAPRSSSMVQQNGPFSSLNSLRSHMSGDFTSPTFEPNSLNQQIRRAASLSSLNTDIFLQDGSEGEKDQAVEDTTLLNADSIRTSWRLPTTTTRASDSLPISATVAALQYYPPAQQRTRGQYRSRTSTTSSSVSSLDDNSAKHSTVDSPEQNNMTMFGRKSSHSNTSSSQTRGTSSLSPELNQLEDNIPGTTKAPSSSLQESEDIQTAISLMLAEGEDQEQWRNIYNPLETTNMSQMNLLESGNNASFTTFANGNTIAPQAQNLTSSSVGVQTQAGPFKSWRHTRILAPILREDNRTNQELLRRCIDMMKQIPNLQQGAQNQSNGGGNASTTQPGQAVTLQQQQGISVPRVAAASSSSPETTVPDIGISHDPFDQPGPPRVQRRPRGGSRIASMGPVHTGHDEAAMNHMMAERRRRVKQKENFAALRRLVPIISKADKASILGDAIVYLKDLQEQIKEVEVSRDAAQRRFEALQVSYKDLERRNKELEAMANNSSSSASVQQRGSTTTGLHSMQSF